MTGRDAVLVTGATGKVGREVVHQVAAAGTPVRALARDPGSARLPAGTEVVRGDLAEPRTLAPALAGTGTVFLVWPTLAAEHAARETLEVIAKHARRVVYLSANGVPDNPAPDRGPGAEAPASILDSHALLERLIESSGLEWTFLRPTGFAANTLGWAGQIRADGVVRWPYAAAARSLIHERDIAAVAARVLTGDGGGYGRAKLVLSGPQAVTQAEQVRLIGEAAGRPARFEEIPPEQARRELAAAWGVPGAVDAALRTWASFADEPETVTSTVRDITGRPARTFREWAVDHAADFR
jgi:uncharacterized protein YbjT (DUF2867 family)